MFILADSSQANYNYSTGRWLQRDPLGVNPAGGPENPFSVSTQYTDEMNLYEYVKSQPINVTDSEGLFGGSDHSKITHEALSWHSKNLECGIILYRISMATQFQ